MKTDFFRCGMYGWCLEILWTGLHSLTNHDRKLMGVSSLHMFPIYGMAAFLSPISHVMKGTAFWKRGLVYTCFIFLAEFVTGSLLKEHNMCPWDYSRSRFNVRGVIRLDYAPLWFLTGLLYEKLLQRGSLRRCNENFISS